VIESAISQGGTLKVDGELITIEDILDNAKELELKHQKDDSEELWDYEPLEEILQQEKFFIRSLKLFELGKLST